MKDKVYVVYYHVSPLINRLCNMFYDPHCIVVKAKNVDELKGFIMRTCMMEPNRCVLTSIRDINDHECEVSMKGFHAESLVFRWMELNPHKSNHMNMLQTYIQPHNEMEYRLINYVEQICSDNVDNVNLAM